MTAGSPETGMRVVQVEHPQGVALVHATAAQYIPDYGAEASYHQEYREDLQGRLEDLFAGHGPAPEASAVIAATDQTGTELYGAVVVETPCQQRTAEQDPERARALARSHRTLAAIFVKDELRGTGLGTHLLREHAAGYALRSGARYLDGFVDDRAGSVDFYRHAGAVVMDHNTGLPARRPSNTPLAHVPDLDGHWFYLDTWPIFEGPLLVCSRCQRQLRFDPSDGGELVCDPCGLPPGR